MKKLLLLGIPLVTLAGLNVWSQAVAEPAHIRGPGVVVRDGAGPDLAADVREAEIPAAAPAKTILKSTAMTAAKNVANGTAKDPPAPLDAGSLDRITVFVPAAPAEVSSHDAADDDSDSGGRWRAGKHEGSRSGHGGGRYDR